jgi:hypothetical protein
LHVFATTAIQAGRLSTEFDQPHAKFRDRRTVGAETVGAHYSIGDREYFADFERWSGKKRSCRIAGDPVPRAQDLRGVSRRLSIQQAGTCKASTSAP